jgi:hypothetical protein
MPAKYSEDDWERMVFSKLRADTVLGCWEWEGGRTTDGYGCARFKGASTKIHRAIYRHFYGELPQHIGVLHRCDNRLCCNPFHWFTGTQADNINDAVKKGRQPKAQGERQWAHILTADDVLNMRRIKRETGRTNADIASEYGVASITASQAITGHSWAHLPGAIEKKRYKPRAKA